MSLEDTLKKDLIEAMKAKDNAKVSTLRMIKASMMNYLINSKKEKLEDGDVVAILKKELKQRRESYDSFTAGGRKDLADKESTEMKILEHYVPPELSDEEISVLAQKCIDSTQAKSIADMGKVMKELMPLVKGKADGKRVNEIVSRLIALAK